MAGFTGSFAGAMKNFFGLAPGQTLVQFGAELKALTDADKAWFKAELEKNGYVFNA